MATASSLTKRIDAAFSAAEKRLDQFRAQHVQEYQDRHERLAGRHPSIEQPPPR